MSRYTENCVIFLVIFVVALCVLLPANCQAHGTGYRVLDGEFTVSVGVYYSGGEPMSFAEVLLFSPENREAEYQNGRTDRLGRFSFTPNTTGIWIVEAGDGRGHKVSAKIRVEKLENALAIKSDTEQRYDRPQPLAIALGLSIIFNVFGAIALARKRVK